ncbi:MAG: hypothetical protein K6T30_01550 [Alicyclobacillus sp.]|nr:hypothetical protein [Alicyclobacillus sp.]
MEQGLWDDIERYVADLLGDPDGQPGRLDDSEGPPSNAGMDLQAEVSARPVPEPRRADMADRTRESEETAAAAATPLSDSMRRERAGIKQRYIVGKRVGRDLLAPDGTLLARTGEAITPAIVEAAEDHGKLVELIVHMTLDGIEE